VKRTSRAVIRIASCLFVVELATLAFHAARERNLGSMCMQIGLILALVPYAAHPEWSPLFRHGRKSVGGAIVSVSQDIERGRRWGSLYVSMSVGALIFVGIGLGLVIYENFIK
jgi:hypothetical protein